MERKADVNVERAFREWCAMMGITSVETGKVGEFHLGRYADGMVRIEQVVGADGEMRAVGPWMTESEFCNAVNFLHESLKIIGQQVAHKIGSRRRSLP